MTKHYLSVAVLTVTMAALTVGCQTNGGNQSQNNSAGATAPANTASENKTENKPAETKGAIVPVFDGRTDSDPNGDKATAAETAMVRAEVKKHEAAIKSKVKFPCDIDERTSIISTATGAFTKVGAQQKMYLYELCRAGHSFGIGGMIITEGDRAVAHYAYGENGLEINATALSDINKNGVSEILLFGGGTGQGYTELGISIIEIKDGNFDFIGGDSVYSDNSGAAMDDSKIKTTATNISVEPGATPVFYRENYEKKGDGGKWTIVDKQEKFTLEKGTPPKWVKII